MVLPHHRGRFLVLFCLLGLVLAGCGQKGALYLPKESAVVQKAP
jgi:predicted small lipoprotein YifL